MWLLVGSSPGECWMQEVTGGREDREQVVSWGQEGCRSS